jgi:anti-anti-sigma factor
MTALTRPFRHRFLRRVRAEPSAASTERVDAPAPDQTPVEIAPDDPLLAHLQRASGAVDVDELELDSAALVELRAAGVKLVVPLVSQGELIGAGVTAVVLNFSALDYMNSGGIGLLVMLLVRARRKGQKVLAFGLSEHYRQIFELPRLDEAIGVYNTQDDALAAAGSAGPDVR